MLDADRLAEINSDLAWAEIIRDGSDYVPGPKQEFRS